MAPSLADAYLTTPVTRELIRLVAPQALCMLLLLLPAGIILKRWISAARSSLSVLNIHHLHKDQRGAAHAVDFALTFPIFLSIVALVVQFALMMNAAVVVHYAAFCAVRSAIVWIPKEVGGEGPNQFSDSGEKQKKIEQAAAFACIPISPPLTELGSGAGLGGGHGLSMPSLPFDVSGSNVNLTRLMDKWGYASGFTEAEVENSTGVFDRMAPITVKVSHYFFLNIPFANRVLSDSGAFGVYGANITARFTLHNEGDPEEPG